MKVADRPPLEIAMDDVSNRHERIVAAPNVHPAHFPPAS
jgi:hypothetical protein